MDEDVVEEVEGVVAQEEVDPVEVVAVDTEIDKLRSFIQLKHIITHFLKALR